jgi:hypothetical protein
MPAAFSDGGMRQASIPQRWGRNDLSVVVGMPIEGPSMIDQWNEPLECPQCHQAGLVSLCQPRDAGTPIVHYLPDGFKAIHTEYGPNFHCGACGVPIQP